MIYQLMSSYEIFDSTAYKTLLHKKIRKFEIIE